MISGQERHPDPAPDEPPAPVGNFKLVDTAAEPIVESTPGNRSRVLAHASKGSTCMSVVERWLDPGASMAPHRHPKGVEEVIWVRAGSAEITVDGDQAVLTADQTVVIPPLSPHSIRAVGDETISMLCRYSSATPTALNEADQATAEPPWVGGY